jgi:hypothetical protein
MTQINLIKTEELYRVNTIEVNKKTGKLLIAKENELWSLDKQLYVCDSDISCVRTSHASLNNLIGQTNGKILNWETGQIISDYTDSPVTHISSFKKESKSYVYSNKFGIVNFYGTPEHDATIINFQNSVNLVRVRFDKLYFVDKDNLMIFDMCSNELKSTFKFNNLRDVVGYKTKFLMLCKDKCFVLESIKKEFVRIQGNSLTDFKKIYKVNNLLLSSDKTIYLCIAGDGVCAHEENSFQFKTTIKTKCDISCFDYTNNLLYTYDYDTELLSTWKIEK